MKSATKEKKALPLPDCFPFAELRIVNYHPQSKTFLVECCRCTTKQEIAEDHILEPLMCYKCDEGQEQQSQCTCQPTSQCVGVPMTTPMGGPCILVPMILKNTVTGEEMVVFMPMVPQPEE